MRNEKKIKAHFPTSIADILDRVAAIDAVAYGPSRNYLDGAVSYLSPYISRGVISTKLVYHELLNRGYHPSPILKFIQELAWRDYWQNIWVVKGEAINHDLKSPQEAVTTNGISTAITTAKTGITTIDHAIAQFYNTGYLHNHVRMYLANIACNIGQNHWKAPAQWMYYHLLDADWASNALSWQWVAGTNSSKKYYANQENINTFTYSEQRHTFLDVSYDAFDNLKVPEVLLSTKQFDLKTPLPEQKAITINSAQPTLIYTFYNLDPRWKKEMYANRILLLEPSHFKKYPVSQKTIDFTLALSKNIAGIQVYVGEFDAFISTYNISAAVYYKEHPLNKHYRGIEEQREWMFSVKGYYPSFFSFWKRCKKEIPF